MNILIFKTVCKDRFTVLLESLDTKCNHYYIVMPEDEINDYKILDGNIRCIGTSLGCIDYNTFTDEKMILTIYYDEIWVLSSSYDRRFSYVEAYSVISELRYRRFVYKVIHENEIIEYRIQKQIFFPIHYSLIVNVIKVYSDLLYLYEKKVKGFKW